MTIKVILTMLICIVPVWGGLILCILRLQKMDLPQDDEEGLPLDSRI